MRKALVIAVREYNAAVRTKAFLVSIVFLPVLMLGSVVVQTLLKDKVDTRPKHYAILDRTDGAAVWPALQAAAEKRNATVTRDAAGKRTRPEYVLERVAAAEGEALDALRLALSERVRAGELMGIAEIGRDVWEPAPDTALAAPDDDFSAVKAPPERLAIRYQTHSHTDRDFSEWLKAEVSLVVQTRRTGKTGLSVDEVRGLLRPVPVLAKNLSTRDAAGNIQDGVEANRAASFLLPAGLVMLMFMMIWVGATPLMQGVVEEKMQRIAEVLLGSVRPFPLMMGKLLGTVGVATTLGGIYLAGAFFAAYRYNLTEHLSPRLVAWFLVYQTLGVLLYGSLFAAIGAACTSTQEAQTLLMPVTFLVVMPMFVLMTVVRDPDGTLATTLSLIPTATPMLMVARLSASPSLPVWQPALGVVLVLATTTACVWAAGRVFRVGLLVQGKGAGFRDMARWVLRG